MEADVVGRECCNRRWKQGKNQSRQNVRWLKYAKKKGGAEKRGELIDRLEGPLD